MAKKKLYVCWVRAIPASLAGGGYKLKNGHPRVVKMRILSGPKRPKRTKVDGKEAADVWFDAHAVHYGNPKSDIVFDFGPAFGDPDEAEEWLETTGQQWAREASNFFLLELQPEKV